MSLALIELAASCLGPDLLGEVAFLGGATMFLWVAEDGASPPQPTEDVDVIIELVSLVSYYEVGERLKTQRFEEDPDARQVCAWRHLDTKLRVDVMPTEGDVLGFSNRWYPDALQHAVEFELPSKKVIRAVSPPYLLATKLEAFNDRGHPNGEPDFLGSRDFGDIIALIDGRDALVDEVRVAAPELRTYIADELARLRDHFAFSGGIKGQLRPDPGSQERQPLVMERVQQIINVRP